MAKTRQRGGAAEVSLRGLFKVFGAICLVCTVTTFIAFNQHVSSVPMSNLLPSGIYLTSDSHAYSKQLLGFSLSRDIAIADALSDNNTIVEGKEGILKLLLQAGIEHMDLLSLQQLPTKALIEEVYGDAPVVLGLEQCHDFQSRISPEEAFVAPAGIFNSGTNILYTLLSGNCQMPKSKFGVQWQVSWGKHMLAERMHSNTASGYEIVNKSNVMPVVIVRDPYTWMKSMCKHPYSVMWHHSKEHCPNLVPNAHDYKLYKFPGRNIPVRIKPWGKPAPVWNSLAHLWSDWYQQYHDFDGKSRLIVRFEDLIFSPQQVVEQVCRCVGGIPFDDFRLLPSSAKVGKGHGDKTSLVGAMTQYGPAMKRTDGYTKDDLKLAHEALNAALMNALKYKRPLE